MIQTESYLQIVDNSGVKIAKCIQIPKKKTATIGDIVIVSVQKLNPKKGSKKIKKGEILNCLIVRTKNRMMRKDGSYISFTQNAGVILNKQGNLIGSRSFGYTVRELRKKYIKILSTFERVI